MNEILDQICGSYKDTLIKARLHDIHFGHGTLKFWHANPFCLARHSWFLSCKRKIKDPRAQNFRRAETSSGGSLGPPKKRSADHLLRSFQKITKWRAKKEKVEGNFGQTKLRELL